MTGLAALPTQAGRTVVVTGASTGIGRVTALELARAGAHVILACRSRSKTEPVIAELKQASGNDRIELLVLDLASLESVRRAAGELLARDLPIHVLVNNAGIVAVGTTQEGFELTFGTNHLGPYLFTRLLLPRLSASGPARVVNVASRSHRHASGIDFEAVRKKTATVSAYPEYAVSKLANILFSAELARRLGPDSPVHAYSLHPGRIATDAWRRVPWPIRPLVKLFMLSVEEGARTTLYCATSPAVAADTGLYYDDCRVTAPVGRGSDRDLARELWDRSAEWVGLPP